jgi:hypothetical protein
MPRRASASVLSLVTRVVIETKLRMRVCFAIQNRHGLRGRASSTVRREDMHSNIAGIRPSAKSRDARSIRHSFGFKHSHIAQSPNFSLVSFNRAWIFIEQRYHSSDRRKLFAWTDADR